MFENEGNSWREHNQERERERNRVLVMEKELNSAILGKKTIACQFVLDFLSFATKPS